LARSQLYKDYDYMNDAYTIRRLSCGEIAAEIGIPKRTINGWMHTLNIPVRPWGIGKNIIDISDYLKSFIDGELLGDGTMTKCGVHSAYYQHGSQYEEYVDWLEKEFTREGVKQGGEIDCRTHHCDFHNGSQASDHDAYHYRSLSYVAFRPFRSRFYPEKDKIVPKDIVIDPVVLRQWYLGDGCISQYPYSKNITLYTCSFSRDDVEFLSDKLRDIGLTVTYNKHDNAIRVGARSVDDFLDFTGPCPIGCYSYKWNRHHEKAGGR